METVFQGTCSEVSASLQEIWHSPRLTLDERLVLQYQDAVRRYYEFNSDESGRSPWRLEEHYDVVRSTIRRAYGRPEPK